MQHEIRHQLANHSDVAVHRIEHRHVENADVSFALFDNLPPLHERLFVVATQSIQRLDDEQIPLAELP